MGGWCEADYHAITNPIAPSMISVRSWKVVLCLAAQDDEDRETCVPFGFGDLCEQVLSKASLHSLDIAIMPKNYEFRYTRGDYYTPSQVLRPLDYIRNVTNVTLRDAEYLEIPDYYGYPTSSYSDKEGMIKISELLSQFHDCPELKVDLTIPVKGSSPVEFASQMYVRLLRYAQAFERYEYFRLEMALPLGKIVSLRDVKDDLQLSNERSRYNDMGGARNPFRGDLVHPVELTLTLADSAQRNHDADLFKIF
ncbi:hypothetical protein GLAREA_01264 [Glarea lozoyensis ATCC 20868]|uniref:Uncharacterized protein n=1 Tax=Glarea lozoyensis (strain ATCC 20868 / MF5171) TaxID=1116229 RepID=S3CFT1_GLAL2|nr:uncharacterized protein GLAREA_01264 [Glarea lozoyensis ATCC 20868]EPE25352.1 hypothetical protein GLAREA_01264 [Glarea lozoyensis ATCC 20868]